MSASLTMTTPSRDRREPPGALTKLHRAANRLTKLPTQGPAAWLHHRTLQALHGFLAAACAAGDAGTPLDKMREATAAARTFARYSRTLAHAQTWPRGYPGDFQLIERLLDAEPAGEPETLERVLDNCVLQLPIVWQHRAKVAWQARLVRRRLGDAERIRVLSVGCGGSRDLMLLESHELARLELVLTDLDADALELSKTRLRGRVRELTAIQGNALRSANRLSAVGPFDAIVIGGLLDYLPERAARTLLKHVAAMLAPGGLLGVTNIATSNPWRLMLDLVADWTLIDRTHDEMSSLLSVPGLTPSIKLDDTRITWLATATQ